MKRIAWYAFLVLATISVLFILWEFRRAILLFLLSLAVAAAFRPLSAYFAGESHAGAFRRGAALGLSYIIVIGLTALLIVLASGPLINDLQNLSNAFAMGYRSALQNWPHGSSPFLRSLAGSLPAEKDLYAALTGGEILPSLVGVTSSLFDGVSGLVIVLVLSLYWSANNLHFERLWLSLLPVERRARARQTWRDIEAEVGAYIRSELAQSLLAGFLLWGGYSLLGLPYPTLLALVGAVVWLIPWFGMLIAILPALAIALSGQPILGTGAALYTLAVLSLMEWWLQPRLIGRNKYSSVLLLLIALALLDVSGLFGFILAPLLAAALQITYRHLSQQPAAKPATPPAVAQPVGLAYAEGVEPAAPFEFQQRILEIQDLAKSHNGDLSLELANLVQRMEKLVEEADKYFPPVN